MRNKDMLFIRYGTAVIGPTQIGATKKVSARGLNVFAGAPVASNQMGSVAIAA